MKLARICGMVLMAVALAACGEQQAEKHHHHEEMAAGQNIKNEFAKEVSADAMVLNVATDANFPPYEFRDAYGNIIGWDIDLINAIAADQNMKVVVRQEPWRNIFNLIATPNQNSNQVIISAMGYTDERAAQYDLTQPYLDSSNTVLVLENSPIQTLQDLAGKNVAITEGSIAEGNVKKAGAPEYHAKYNASTYLNFKDLVSGSVDAVIDDGVSLNYHMKNHPEYKVRRIVLPETGTTVEHFVIATNKGNAALVAKLNQGLQNIRNNGTYEKINQKWFGANTQTEAASAPAAEEHVGHDH